MLCGSALYYTSKRAQKQTSNVMDLIKIRNVWPWKDCAKKIGRNGGLLFAIPSL